jgi:hypothetical protein
MANAVAQIVITLTDDGQVALAGQVPGELLARGMLDKAKEILAAKCVEQTAGKPATPLLVASSPLPKNGRG